MQPVSVNHYENFPVASLLCPAHLRPAVAAIYWFARTADDLADEGEASPETRLADLAAYRGDLTAVAAGRPPSPRWATSSIHSRARIVQFGLPIHLLADLLSAFEQDVVKQRYADRAELLDYCRRSADPVGRLLLHLYRVDDAASLARSDAICSALQLANFWQDLSVDTLRGRLYVPLADCRRHAVEPEALLTRTDSPASRALIADLLAWTRSMMLSGAPLVHAVPGRAGWELRLVVQGGLRILDKVAQLDGGVLRTRPKLDAFDALLMSWRALWMRHADEHIARRAA
jgi:squalene synthase HpnC